VTAKDTAGNEGDGEVTFTVLGGTVRGQVIGAEGQAAPAGVPVKLGSLDLATDADGRYRKDGLRAGTYTARATDPVSGLESPAASGDLADGGELVLEDLLRRRGRSNGGALRHHDQRRRGRHGEVGGRTYTTARRPRHLAALLPGLHVVEARTPRATGSVSVAVKAGAPRRRVVLNGVARRRSPFKADGVAAAGATVTID
jgi:hypothetical protein